MNDKRSTLTPEQVAERKARWWGEARNARRKARYQTDPEYREQAIQQVRAAYSRTRLEAGLTLRQGDCRENLSRLSEIGQVRALRGHETAGARTRCFTMDELANALGRNTQVLYRWIRAGMLPTPVYEARNHRARWQGVYLEAEVRAVLLVFGEHQRKTQYYGELHRDTRERMFEVLGSVRAAHANGPKRALTNGLERSLA